MKARILVVDDDPLLRELLTDLLSAHGHDVTVATDGREGMAHLARQPVDLIVTDLLMPNQDGIETITAVRKTHPMLPIVAITGGNRLDPDYYLRMAATLGATRVLKKPFRIEEFRRCVDELLAWRQVN